MSVKKRNNREPVMGAPSKGWDPKIDRTAGMYMSEKLDGMRCLWIPCTRGLDIANVPFANRAKDKRDFTCTGLWSKYGKIIHCPEWFTAGFPDYPLDGELFGGRKKFQGTMSVVKELVPNEDSWKGITFQVLDTPTYAELWLDGRCNNTQYKYDFDQKSLLTYFDKPNKQSLIFDYNYRIALRDLRQTAYLKIHEQIMLSTVTATAVEQVREHLKFIVDAGGEGLILRHPASNWKPYKERYVLKVKPHEDAEGTIIGFRAGTGKLEGMMGSLKLKFNDKIFELSGFTDDERSLNYCNVSPGEELQGQASAIFTIGEQITFTYRELSDDGVPKEARFLRTRRDE